MNILKQIIQIVQVNIPFTMLYESYLDTFLEYGLNPEIGLDAEALDRYSIADFTGIAKDFQRQSRTVTLHGPFIDLNPGSPDPAVRRLTRHRLEQTLKLVPVFRPLSVVCHANFDERRYGYFKKTWLKHSLEFWTWLADRLAEYDVLLMLENVFEGDPQELKMILEKLGHRNVGFCLDTGHATAFGQSNLEEWLKVLGPILRQLHLHDNYGNQDDHLAIGSGIVEFDKLFQYLKKSTHPPPIITLEPHAEKYLWSSLEYLAEHWPWHQEPQS